MAELTSFAFELKTNETSDTNQAATKSNDNKPAAFDTYDASGLSLRLVNNSPIDFNQNKFSLAYKRVFDFCGAFGGLIFFIPLFVIVAVLIWLQDRGPIFFTQKRVGFKGKEFKIYKFRSMYTNHCDLDGVKQTVADDARITPIGRFIRKTSIDEIPQLLNILMGDMSFVGPRPHVRAQLAGNMPYAFVVPYYNKRHLVRPGLTGWAQVNGLRGDTTDIELAKARVNYDLAYAVNQNFWLDLKIVLKTIRIEFLGGTGR